MAHNPLKARLGPRMVPLSKVGQKSWFPWDHIDTSEWPGRELFWVWCHPILSVWMLSGSVAFVWLLVTDA